MFTSQMAKAFFDSLPPGLSSLRQEMENHLEQFLQSCFNNMNLVTREELDIQVQVLAKTRAKLEALEEKLNQMTTQD